MIKIVFVVFEGSNNSEVKMIIQNCDCLGVAGWLNINRTANEETRVGFS